jgi:hypothetical protein
VNFGPKLKRRVAADKLQEIIHDVKVGSKMNPSQGAQIRGCHILEKLDASSVASTGTGILQPHPTFENRG